MNSKIILSLICALLFSNCIFLQNQRLKNINYPETPFFSGFLPGRSEINEEYSLKWCQKFCNQLQSIVQNLPEDYYLEIRGKVDATELPINRERLSLDRARSIKQLLSANGFSEGKLKAITDPEPDEYLGKDKFDPENRKVRFRIQKEK